MDKRATRVFLIYAEEDYRFCDLMISQARSSKLAVEFAHMQVKQPWVPRWKGLCRARVRECNGAIVLISKKTHEAAGVKWELECACEGQLPILGIFVNQGDKGPVPEEIRDSPLIEWDWPEIAKFVHLLNRDSLAGGSASSVG
jgi:hypothetical protein